MFHKDVYWLIIKDSFELNEGDAVLYAGCDQEHGRPGIYKGEGMAQVFLHYVRKEGKYVAELKSNSDPRPGEVIFGPDAYGGYPSSGIKGYFATVIISTDAGTDPAGEKTIFSTFSNNVVSST